MYRIVNMYLLQCLVYIGYALRPVHEVELIKLYTMCRVCIIVTTFCSAPLHIVYPVKLHHPLHFPEANWEESLIRLCNCRHDYSLVHVYAMYWLLSVTHNL